MAILTQRRKKYCFVDKEEQQGGGKGEE